MRENHSLQLVPKFISHVAAPKRALADLRSDERGASAASYVITVGLVGLVGLGGFTAMGGAFDGAIAGGANGTMPTPAADGQGASRAQAFGPAAQAGMASTLTKIAENLGGVSRPAEELVEVLHPLLVAPEWNAAVGLRFRPPMRVLLEGANGSGKTSLVRETAEAMGVNLVRRKAIDLIDGSAPGATAQRIEGLFSEARASGKPSVVLIEDLDDLANIDPRQFPTHLFVNPLEDAMSGLSPAERIAVVATARDAEVVGRVAPSLAEASAFDRRVRIPEPDQAAIVEILEKHLRGMKTSDDVSLEGLATIMKGSFGPEIGVLVQRAASHAIRRFRRAVEAGEAERPARLVSERAPRVRKPKTPAVEWSDPESVARAHEWFADTYALNEQGEQYVRGLAAALRSATPEGEKVRTQLAVEPQKFQGQFESWLSQDLTPRRAIASQETRVRKLDKALRASESTFPLSIEDFDSALRELGKEGALRRIQEAREQADKTGRAYL